MQLYNNNVSERKSCSCSLENKGWAQWTAEMQADVNRKTHVKSTISKRVKELQIETKDRGREN